MTGIIDVGGGMRGVFTSGIYDYMLDNGLSADIFAGVSAGSANIASFLSGQYGRSKRFYLEYSLRNEYMSLKNFLKKGSYVDLDYVYSTLSNSNGEDPLDYSAFEKNPADFIVVATDAVSGKAHYFSKSDISQDNYNVMKASSALPAACRPYFVKGRYYYDGGISDPIPYRFLLEKGCDRIVLLLTRPKDFRRLPQKHPGIYRRFLRQFPESYNSLMRRHLRYNRALEAVAKLERQSKALIIAPSDITGIDTLKNNRQAMERLYREGYRKAAALRSFLA